MCRHRWDYGDRRLWNARRSEISSYRNRVRSARLGVRSARFQTTTICWRFWSTCAVLEKHGVSEDRAIRTDLACDPHGYKRRHNRRSSFFFPYPYFCLFFLSFPLFYYLWPSILLLWSQPTNKQGKETQPPLLGALNHLTDIPPTFPLHFFGRNHLSESQPCEPHLISCGPHACQEAEVVTLEKSSFSTRRKEKFLCHQSSQFHTSHQSLQHSNNYWSTSLRLYFSLLKILFTYLWFCALRAVHGLAWGGKYKYKTWIFAYIAYFIGLFVFSLQIFQISFA